MSYNSISDLSWNSVEGSASFKLDGKVVRGKFVKYWVETEIGEYSNERVDVERWVIEADGIEYTITAQELYKITEAR